MWRYELVLSVESWDGPADKLDDDFFERFMFEMS